jgi:hypothetical protein
MAKDTFVLKLKSALDVEDDKFYYVKNDPRQYPRQLKSIKLDIGSGAVLYGLALHDEEELFYYERDISEDEDVMMRQKFGDE